MKASERERLLAKELYEHRNDQDEWEEEEAPITVRPNRSAVVSCRFPMEEMHALERAAKAAHESISEYVRKAVLIRQSGMAHGSYIQAVVGGAYTAQVQLSTSANFAAQWTEAPSSSDQRVSHRDAVR